MSGARGSACDDSSLEHRSVGSYFDVLKQYSVSDNILLADE